MSNATSSPPPAPAVPPLRLVRSSSAPLSADEIIDLRAVVADAGSMKRACEVLRINPHTLKFALAGLALREGTRLVIAARLEELSAQPATSTKAPR